MLIGAGDIAKCGSQLRNAEATAKLLDDAFGADSADQGTVFTLGDTAYARGTAREFADCYATTWGRHKQRTRPAVGNHEYKTKGAKPYYDYFGAAAGDPAKGYYSYELGSWRVVVLNTNCRQAGGCGPGSPQYRWLERELKQNPRRCSLAYGHHPLFSSGKHRGQKQVKPLVELLHQSGAELYLAGHDHNYERFAPQDPNGNLDPQAGVRQFVVGTGGRELRRLGKTAANSEVRDDTSYGVLKLSLGESSYEWEFIPIAGHSFRDSGSGSCR